jgi:hypothetical protein
VILLATAGTSLLQTTPARAGQPHRAAQLLSQALADARAEGSFHVVMTGAGGGSHGTLTDDVGTDSGRQHITASTGTVANVEVVDGHAYFTGNHVALLKYFGLPSRVVAALGSRWVSLSPSDSGYKTIADDVTMRTALSGLGPVGDLSEGHQTTIDGQAVVGISGKAPGMTAGATGEETAYVTDTSHPLPVVISSAVTQRPHQRVSNTIRFSDWGEHLAISAPADSISIDRLGS